MGNTVNLAGNEGVLAPTESLEIGELDLPLLKKVHEPVESVQLGLEDLAFVDLQQADQRMFQVRFAHVPVKVCIETLEGILHRQILPPNPLLDLLHH